MVHDLKQTTRHHHILALTEVLAIIPLQNSRQVPEQETPNITRTVFWQLLFVADTFPFSQLGTLARNVVRPAVCICHITTDAQHARRRRYLALDGKDAGER